jgi:hypothetical protein
MPALCEVYASKDGRRWVVLDIGEGYPRKGRPIRLRQLGTVTSEAVKVVTIEWFLTSYTFVGTLDAEDQPVPLEPPGAEGLRAWNLRRLRTSLGLAIRHMSRRTGVGGTFLTEMETGRRAISIRTIDRIAAGLGLAPSKVLAELDAPAR